MKFHFGKKNGFAIALAWPQTLCKQAGGWYDRPMRWMGFNRGHYYRVGHAAVVLVNAVNGDCHYFDFGRYHAPFGHGRVRDAFTDHDLEIKSKAVISSSGIIENFNMLLQELSTNSSCHGNGVLHASYTRIEFEPAMILAKQLQGQSPVPYGPFLRNGTNCSRFVNSVLLAGRPSLFYRIQLHLLKTISPTPAGNVKSLKNHTILHTENEYDRFGNVYQPQIATE